MSLVKIADVIARLVFHDWFESAQKAGHLPPVIAAPSAPVAQHIGLEPADPKELQNDGDPIRAMYTPRPATAAELRAIGVDTVAASLGRCSHGVPIGGLCEMCDIEALDRYASWPPQ